MGLLVLSVERSVGRGFGVRAFGVLYKGISKESGILRHALFLLRNDVRKRLG